MKINFLKLFLLIIDRFFFLSNNSMARIIISVTNFIFIFLTKVLTIVVYT
jgi:hypothetical protein